MARGPTVARGPPRVGPCPWGGGSPGPEGVPAWWGGGGGPYTHTGPYTVTGPYPVGVPTWPQDPTREGPYPAGVPPRLGVPGGAEAGVTAGLPPGRLPRPRAHWRRRPAQGP